MSIKNPVVLILSGSFLFLIGIVVFLTMTTQVVPNVKASESAKASISQTQFDWGNISYSGPKATKTFTIANVGTDTLQLFNIRTSCMCTNAYVSINGEDSPQFGMDMGNNVSSYIGKVAPQGKATLTVVFDPAYHGPQGIGPITRYVEVDTNDKTNPKLTFTLTGTVVKN